MPKIEPSHRSQSSSSSSRDGSHRPDRRLVSDIPYHPPRPHHPPKSNLHTHLVAFGAAPGARSNAALPGAAPAASRRLPAGRMVPSAFLGVPPSASPPTWRRTRVTVRVPGRSCGVPGRCHGACAEAVTVGGDVIPAHAFLNSDRGICRRTILFSPPGVCRHRRFCRSAISPVHPVGWHRRSVASPAPGLGARRPFLSPFPTSCSLFMRLFCSRPPIPLPVYQFWNPAGIRAAGFSSSSAGRVIVDSRAAMTRWPVLSHRKHCIDVRSSPIFNSGRFRRNSPTTVHCSQSATFLVSTWDDRSACTGPGRHRRRVARGCPGLPLPGLRSACFVYEVKPHDALAWPPATAPAACGAFGVIHRWQIRGLPCVDRQVLPKLCCWGMPRVTVERVEFFYRQVGHRVRYRSVHAVSVASIATLAALPEHLPHVPLPLCPESTMLVVFRACNFRMEPPLRPARIQRLG